MFVVKKLLESLYKGSENKEFGIERFLSPFEQATFPQRFSFH